MDKALKWLGVALFLLFAAPRMSLRLGPIPMYFIDGLWVLAWFYAMKLPKLPRTSPMSKWVLGLMLVAFLSELHGAMYIHDIARPVYTIFRTILAMSLFFLVPRLVRNKEAAIYLFKWIAAGMLVSAVLMLLSSLPPTRGLARIVFELPLLDPAGEGRYMTRQIDAESAIRGKSLIGVSILTGFFVNAAWPMVLFLREKSRVSLSLTWRLVITAGCVLAPLGVLASYSRGAILGWLAVVAGALLFTKSKSLKSGVLVGGMFLLVLVWVMGTDSKMFFFDRLENRTAAMFDAPLDDAREAGRVYAYLHPFIYVGQHPVTAFIGTGNAKDSMASVPMHPIFKTGADHAVFAQATYSYGMFSAVAYCALLGTALLHAFKYIRQTSFTGMYAQTLFLSLVGVVPWFMLGHAAVSQPRGAMLFFVLLGFVHVLSAWGTRDAKS
ncbi:O-antigen ligase family protein [Rubritalea marina]|uniref:O-antigen ligase family protein n=1 Tax=Rubritalea marina TaxID=361055 RepID=UPI00038105A1|nr:O-antigen ligase family protein [Rubritalea marina]